MGAALGVLWQTRGRLSEARALLERLLGQPHSINATAGRARALYTLTCVLWTLGEMSTMFERLANALELSRRLGERVLTAYILQMLWWVGPSLGRWPEATVYLEEALAIARDVDDDPVLANALSSQGFALFWVDRDIVQAK